MKNYTCIFSKYDDTKILKHALKQLPLNDSNSIYFIVPAFSLKHAFEILVKKVRVNEFWDKHRTIHPFYVNNTGDYIYYHEEFNL